MPLAVVALPHPFHVELLGGFLRGSFDLGAGGVGRGQDEAEEQRGESEGGAAHVAGPFD